MSELKNRVALVAVNLSSIGARTGAGSVSVAYGASKAGLEGLTRAYALRLCARA